MDKIFTALAKGSTQNFASVSGMMTGAPVTCVHAGVCKKVLCNALRCCRR